MYLLICSLWNFRLFSALLGQSHKCIFYIGRDQRTRGNSTEHIILVGDSLKENPPPLLIYRYNYSSGPPPLVVSVRSFCIVDPRYLMNKHRCTWTPFLEFQDLPLGVDRGPCTPTYASTSL